MSFLSSTYLHVKFQDRYEIRRQLRYYGTSTPVLELARYTKNFDTNNLVNIKILNTIIF